MTDLGPPAATSEQRSIHADAAPVANRAPHPERYRVLKVAPTPFFADYGCHVRILEEAIALQRHRSEVQICTYPSGRDVAGVSTVRSLAVPGGATIRVGSSKRKVVLDALLSAQAMRTALAFRPSVVHGHLHEGALIGLPVSRAAKCPLVFDFQGSLTAEMIDHAFLRRDSRLYPPLRWLERVINHHADAIITSSRPAADLLVREFGCPAGRIVPVPDGVDPEAFRPYWDYSEADRSAIRGQLGVPPDRKVVVYLGLLAEYQGSSYLLRAARSVVERRPDVHFLLMGYPGEGRYRDLARALGIADHVTCTGRVPYERAPRYLAAGDVAVAPKLSRTEANGKLLNYMALGLATVAFDSPVNRDVLGPAGVFAELASADDLARKLLDLLDNDAEAAGRGRFLRRRVEEHYSWTDAARRILDVYGALKP